MKKIEIIEFRKYMEIEIYESEIALREDIDYDDNSFIMLNYEEVNKLIKILESKKDLIKK